MKIFRVFSLIVILIRISFSSKNKFRFVDNIKEEYIFSDFSNTKCNTSNNYITSFTAKICSASTINSNQNFSFSIIDTNTISHNIKCNIYSNSKMRYLQEIEDEDKSDIESNPYESDFPTKDYCYKTLCEFDGMIKDNFTILINSDAEISIDGLPDNIFISTYFYENLTLHINKCYLVKNVFKQVSKYMKNYDEKIITFLLITSIKAKVEKDENLFVEILLLKKGENEKRNIICKSQYTAEAPQGKEEILAFYDCEVPDVNNIDEYIGLNLSYSADIQNIPINSDLNNPKRTDELIKDETINDYSIITFAPKDIDFQDCEKSGTFKIKGDINGNLININNIGIILYLNDSNYNFAKATCNIPSGYREELNISCTILDNFYNSKIYIPNIRIIDSSTNDTLIQINHISKKELSTCIINQVIDSTEVIKTTQIPTVPFPSTVIIEESDESEEEIKNDIIIDVVFRQINNLEINSGRNSIKFNIIGFTFENKEEGMILPIGVNLVSSDGYRENIQLNCSLDKVINSLTDNVYSLIFNCSLNNINNINNYHDVIIINSSSLINIPSQESNISSALKTDQSISQGFLKDYLDENNLIEIPPLITSASISGENCKEKGVFEIKGMIDKSLDSNLSFYIKIENENIFVRCKLQETEANSEANINCYTYENFRYESLLISSKIVYDINYNELFYLNEVNSTNSIYCSNNDQIQFQKAQKKIGAFVCFRQVSKFRKNGNRYTFFLATFIKKVFDINEKIYLTVEIKSSSPAQQKVKFITKGKSLYFRKLSRREEQTAECTVRTQTSVNENDIGAAGWDCSTGESSIEDASGLDIKESDDISGIPDDPVLIDPAQTDVLIGEGELKDYSIEENLNLLLPLFNTLALNYSLCKQNGSFSFIGSVTSTIEQDVIFNLSLSYPETVFACKLPRVLKDEITEIECYNQEEFQNYTILVEETVIRYENNDFFILRNTSSGERYVTCSTSDSSIQVNSYNGGFSTYSKRYKKSNSGGLGVTGIIVISIFGAVILGGVTILIILIKSRKENQKDNYDYTENRSFQNTSSSYY